MSWMKVKKFWHYLDFVKPFSFHNNMSWMKVKKFWHYLHFLTPFAVYILMGHC
jgi:hypothetical protein